MRSRFDTLVIAVASLAVLALVCAGEWGCTRIFCESPAWGGAKLGWTCIGSKP